MTLPSIVTTTPPPWARRRPSYGLKLLAFCGFFIATVAALVAGIIVVSFLISFLSLEISRTGLAANLTTILIAGVICVVSIAAVVRLWPAVWSPGNFTPRAAPVAPDMAGQPFEVRFRQSGFSRMYRGKGTARFEPEGMVLAGTLAPSGWFQLGIVVLLTVLPIVLFGIGLGIIPALLIGLLIGRKKLERMLPYTALRDVTLDGGQLRFANGDGLPGKVALFTAPIDGERLYREVALRFPAALAVPGSPAQR